MPRDYRKTFEILCRILNVKESKLIRRKDGSVYMTKGIRLGVQSQMPGKRIQIEVYNGKGTGCSGSSLLYSCGAGEFETKVRAIQDALEIRARVMANPKHWHAGDSIGGFRL